uniref:plastoquinol--plastocyanin reductase n=1 Tax=Lotharella oceanica TaxID=641309 RepID=A0A7S2TYS6_9EUKA|eukprot:CAMPEP_0170177956 /NCGR_PEP_ID=MMETSP0040_2-20121228/11489_1 /TAXON_ID=641309 /ORGANISM="Lotharella oceanica, Strain CCMP622" /LENGTH=250 /DNA_ID=CAMNT_0010420865 /DNA_START=25 /DNA_END=777 /DNA_ORIENTATION=+
MAQSRSLLLSVAVNALLVGVLLYSVAFAGKTENLQAGLKAACSRATMTPFQNKVNSYLWKHSSAEVRKATAQAFLKNPDMVPDMGKRKLMNNLVLAAIAPTVLSTLGPYAYYFYPPQTGGGGGAVGALDKLGNPITAAQWFESHKKNARDLVQGIKGDPTYLIVNEENTFNSYGLNAVCTHLGCVVPWDAGENKFKCPCHGSQYAPDGHVIRGPAPRPLALAHVADVEGKIQLAPWTETDFRTGEKPWWV